MLDYVYVGMIIFFLIIILIIAKVEDGDDMEHKEEE